MRVGVLCSFCHAHETRGVFFTLGCELHTADSARARLGVGLRLGRKALCILYKVYDAGFRAHKRATHFVGAHDCGIRILTAHEFEYGRVYYTLYTLRPHCN